MKCRDNWLNLIKSSCKSITVCNNDRISVLADKAPDNQIEVNLWHSRTNGTHKWYLTNLPWAIMVCVVLCIFVPVRSDVLRVVLVSIRVVTNGLSDVF